MTTIYKRDLALLWLRESIYNESGLGAHTSSVLRSLRSSGPPPSNTIAVYSTTAPARASRIHPTISVCTPSAIALFGISYQVSATCGGNIKISVSLSLIQVRDVVEQGPSQLREVQSIHTSYFIYKEKNHINRREMNICVYGI